MNEWIFHFFHQFWTNLKFVFWVILSYWSIYIKFFFTRYLETAWPRELKFDMWIDFKLKWSKLLVWIYLSVHLNPSLKINSCDHDINRTVWPRYLFAPVCSGLTPGTQLFSIIPMLTTCISLKSLNFYFFYNFCIILL